MSTRTRGTNLMLALLLVAGVAAGCSSSKSSATKSSTTSSSSATSGSSTTARSAANLAKITLTGKNTNLVLGAATKQALTGAGITIAPVAPAAAASTGITFPITGGTLTKALLLGAIRHSGGLSFTHAGKTVTATSLNINTLSRTLTAMVNGRRVPLLAVDFTHMARTTSGSEIIASGITTSLNASGAVLLDHGLVTTVFTRGMAIGTVTVYVTGTPS
jgi:hypothetical protein